MLHLLLSACFIDHLRCFENIGYARDGELKLFDFGLAKRLVPDEKTPSGLYNLTANTGSLRYMAPEVALGEPYDLRADTYSFSVVFWQICSLTVPYAGHDVQMHAGMFVISSFNNLCKLFL